MSTRGTSRREFLINSVSGLGAAWVATNYSAIVAAEEYVQQAAGAGQPVKLAFFTDAQAAEVEAMAAQIIPTDDTPGAREARVVNFIDRALVTFERRSTGGLHAGPEGSRRANQAAVSDRQPGFPRSPPTSRFRC